MRTFCESLKEDPMKIIKFEKKTMPLTKSITYILNKLSHLQKKFGDKYTNDQK